MESLESLLEKRFEKTIKMKFVKTKMIIKNYFIYSYIIMDIFTQLFWFFFLLFIILSVYLVCCTKKTSVLYLQIASGFGMFATSKIGRKFLGLV